MVEGGSGGVGGCCGKCAEVQGATAKSASMKR